MIINIGGLVKNLGMSAFHLYGGNTAAAGLSAVKAGVSCIPVIGHIPGVGHVVDLVVQGETSPLSLSERNQINDWLDVDNDGDVDLSDLSEFLHHIADNF